MTVQPNPDTISVSIIIPTHKFGAEFEACLKSICDLSKKPDEVIVVFDGTLQNFENSYKDINLSLYATQKQSGPGAARNMGAQKASGDILFFVDSDVIVNQDSIQQIISFFQVNQKVSAIIGSYDNKPFAKNFISQYRNLMHHYVHQTSNEEAGTFWGACGAIRRKDFFTVGGFDESYDKPSIEDIELGYRLKSAGFEIRLLKSLQIKHLKRWELKSLVMTDFFSRALPWSKLILKNKIIANDLNLKISNRLSVFLVFLSLVFLAGSLWFNWLILLSLLSIITVISINFPFYNFFLKNKGGFFTLKVVPLHLLYYLYSGLAFSISWSDYLLRARNSKSL